MRTLLLLCGAACFCMANTIQVDTGTALLDGSLFTQGETYFAAFQLNGGTVSNTTTLVKNFQLGGGAAAAPQPTDPSAGIFLVNDGNPAPNGIFDTMLRLRVIPSNAFSLYTQRFGAGNSLQFDYFFGGYFTGIQADQFTFQLYDSSLNTLLYEQAIDVRSTPAGTPEPSSLGLVVSGIAAAYRIRRWLAHRTPR